MTDTPDTEPEEKAMTPTEPRPALVVRIREATIADPTIWHSEEPIPNLPPGAWRALLMHTDWANPNLRTVRCWTSLLSHLPRFRWFLCLSQVHEYDARLKEMLQFWALQLVVWRPQPAGWVVEELARYGEGHKLVCAVVGKDAETPDAVRDARVLEQAYAELHDQLDQMPRHETRPFPRWSGSWTA